MIFIIIILLLMIMFFVFKPKPNKLWNEFIKHYDEFEFQSKDGNDVIFNWNNRYDIVVSKPFDIYYAYVLVHNRKNVVLSDYTSKKSVQLANLLRTKHQKLF